MKPARPELPSPFPPLPPQGSASAKPQSLKGTADYYEQFKPEGATSAPAEPAAPDAPIPSQQYRAQLKERIEAEHERYEEAQAKTSQALGSLVAVLALRVGARMGLYLATMGLAERYPRLAAAGYALILADFLHHFLHAILFRHLHEGVQAWVTMAGALALGLVDPNGCFGLKAHGDETRVLVGALTFMLVVLKLALPILQPRGQERSVFLGAESGPNYRPQGVLGRAGLLLKQVWSVI
ncbi:MAG: hypothetical protein M5U26_20235 [Planctomycetota bacterium]|nr:hypothetical protein [Planctomycetota bacterium]